MFGFARPSRTSALVFAALILPSTIIMTPARLCAQWVTNPALNTPICAATENQRAPVIVSDDAGGAILAWEDNRDLAGNDIYAQHMSALGEALWGHNGIAIAAFEGFQTTPRIVPDEAGGAIIVWVNESGVTGNDIYAQRVNRSGTRLWNPAGVPVSVGVGDQFSPVVASDGAGGVLIVYIDNHGTDDNIFAQRIDGSGHPLWGAEGHPICTAAHFQTAPELVADGVGGCVITWHDFRSGIDNDIWAQAMSPAGSPRWAANGVIICNATGNQEFPVIAAVGGGDVIIAWEDSRTGSPDVRAQLLDSTGARQWALAGVNLCSAANEQEYLSALPDGAGGAFIAWEDRRAGGSNYDIYAQRVNGTGTAQWMANGVAVSNPAGAQRSPEAILDGAGGIILTWHDARSGGAFDVFAQRMSATGAPVWPASGIPVSIAPGDQTGPVLTTDQSQGVIVAWEDHRSGALSDIYGQHLDDAGQPGSRTDVATTPGSPGFGPLTIQPNPAANTAIVQFENASGGPVRVDLFDVKGRRVLSVAGRAPEGGTRHEQFELDLASVPRGIYLVRVEAGSSVREAKLVRTSARTP